jgi:hypothetical protein
LVVTVQELAERIHELVAESRAPLPERSHPLTAEDYVELWHGDQDEDGNELVSGYRHVFLALEVMRLNKYSTVDLLRAKFYPRFATEEIPPEALKTLEVAFEYFDKRRKAEAGE